MKINSLTGGANSAARLGKNNAGQKSEKTAKGAKTDGFVGELKEYANENSKQGAYMSDIFI